MQMQPHMVYCKDIIDKSEHLSWLLLLLLLLLLL